jgi:hypothetical protein
VEIFTGAAAGVVFTAILGAAAGLVWTGPGALFTAGFFALDGGVWAQTQNAETKMETIARTGTILFFMVRL